MVSVGERATAAGTGRFASRFGDSAAPLSFRSGLGLTLSTIGLGTYLGREDAAADDGYRAAAVAAVRGGVNVLDTAVNYRLGRSERALGLALADLRSSGFGRDEVVVATKGGYVPSRDPEGYFHDEIVARGLAGPGDLVAGCHSLAPGYLRHQLERSLRNLDLAAVDVYHLHNPEQQLEEVSSSTFLGRIREAFAFLEEAVAEGRVGSYGTATWNGYRVPRSARGALSLEALVQAARDVAGEGHHFRVVQLPLNLAMTEALHQPTQVVEGKETPLLEAAGRLGMTVMTSASILQGRLTRGLPSELRGAFPGLETDAQRALQFARSTPGVTTALVGMSRLDHVKENLGLLGVPPLEGETFAALFRSA